MSGKYGVKTGVTGTPGNLDLNHQSIFKAIEENTDNAYADAVIGKWHLSSPVVADHPYQHGADYYVGFLNAGVDDYYAWQKTEDGVTSLSTEYTTSVLTDRARDWRAEQTDKPWLLWWSHAAPHTPFHTPPAEMYSINNTNNNVRKYIAMIESIDFAINKLLLSIPDEVEENTIIIFVGDNGTPGAVLQDYPDGHGKSTLYQGGVRVPLIISGAGVTRSAERESSLIQVTDLYATILQATGSTLSGGINNSLAFNHMFKGEDGPSRDYNYVDFLSQGEGGHAIRDDRYKLIEFADGNQEFYDLQTDSLEFNDLLLTGLTADQQSIKEDFELEASNIRDSWSCRDYIKNGDEEGIDCGGSHCAECSVNTTDPLLIASKFDIYPNPVLDQLFISSKGDEAITHITFTDLNGKVIETEIVDGKSKVLDTSKLESSIYILNIFTETSTYVQRIIKI